MQDGFKIPEYNGCRFIYDEDQSVWMMLWSHPDSMNNEDYVIMLNDEDRVVVMHVDTFQANFSVDDEKTLPLFNS